MSTRRARIKAVISLPPRRKNVVVAKSQEKETAEKSTTSPLPLDKNRSPGTKNVNESITLENIAHNVIENLITSIKPQSVTVESVSRANTPTVPHTPEKVLSKDNKKTLNVFASPARKDSPKKTFASPFAPSPKVSKSSELQRPHTPLSRPTPTAIKISDNNELQIAENIVGKIDHNALTKKDIVMDDYSIPSVPESTDDETMDGIVPLKPAAKVPKPIDVLKNQIISENAEVLFDPIIPLPSPSKVRPKLRPAPRLGPLRRNSVQGSASESEDENRRGHLISKDRQSHDLHTLQSLPNRDVSRVRNDSVCSSVSQVAQPTAVASPVRDKQQIHRMRRQDECRRRTAMRRRRLAAKRENLTMYDLIFYNPTSKPLVLNDDEIKLMQAKEKQKAEKKTQEKKEETVNPPESPKTSNEAPPVPQIKLGPKGEIILDEQSLVIKQTESERQVASVVHEGAWGSGGEYRRVCRSAGWSAQETIQFYRALAALGTDFSLMTQLFPERTRKQLKVKFKKEEKINGAQIDKALRAPIHFDITQLMKEFEEERALAAKQVEIERERLNKEKQAERCRMRAAKDRRIRQSRGSKALEATMAPPVNKDAINTEDILEHHNNLNNPCKKPATPVTPQIHIQIQNSTSSSRDEMMNSRTNTPSLQIKTPEAINALQIPKNIENGSLVVLTVNDPSSPAKKMLQTYISNGPGKLTPIALPPNLLNHVVEYMKKGSSASSPQLLSPSSVTSVESHNSAPSVAVLPSPCKRQRHSSYTITQL